MKRALKDLRADFGFVGPIPGEKSKSTLNPEPRGLEFRGAPYLGPLLDSHDMSYDQYFQYD